MFSSSVHQFVKSIGNEKTAAVDNITDANCAVLLQIIVKKKKCSPKFWKKNFKLRLSEFNMDDIVIDDDSRIDVKSNKERFVEYNRTTKHSLKGEFGLALKGELMDVDLKGSRSVAVKANFGQTTKTELDLNDLVTQLSKCFLNMNHQFVKDIMKNKKKSFCIVTGVYTIDNDAHLTYSLKTDVETDIKTKLSAGDNPLVDGDITTQRTQEMSIPARTALAFKYRDLIINKSTGSIKMVLDVGVKGGFVDKEDNEPDSDQINGAKSCIV